MKSICEAQSHRDTSSKKYLVLSVFLAVKLSASVTPPLTFTAFFIKRLKYFNTDAYFFRQILDFVISLCYNICVKIVL